MQKSTTPGGDAVSTEHAATHDAAAPVARQPWEAPSSTPRGSIAELVQIAKVSGGDDSSGGRRLVPGK